MMAGAQDEWLHLRVSRSLHGALTAEAQHRNEKVSDFVRGLLEDGLARWHAENGASAVRLAVAKELAPLKAMLRKIADYAGTGAWEGRETIRLLAWLCNLQIENEHDRFGDNYDEERMRTASFNAKVDFFQSPGVGSGDPEVYQSAQALDHISLGVVVETEDTDIEPSGNG